MFKALCPKSKVRGPKANGQKPGNVVASIRVLEKCGVTISSHDQGFANATSEVIEEVVLMLG